MANGAIVCKNPPVYPNLSKLQVAEAAVALSPSAKLAKEPVEGPTPGLTTDVAPRPLRKGGCVPLPIECGPFPRPERRLPPPGIDVGPLPMPPGGKIPGGCFPPAPVNIRDEIRKSIQICPSHGPDGEPVWPTGEQIDKMVDDILKSRLGHGETKGVRGHATELTGEPRLGHGCKGHLVSVEHAHEGHAIGHALKGHAVAVGIGRGEAHAQKATEELHSQNLYARPTGRGGLEPMGGRDSATPLDGMPAPRGDGYARFLQEREAHVAQELATPINQ